MKYRGCLVAAVSASVLALSGCFWTGAPIPVPKPTELEIQEQSERVLDANWEWSGLADTLARPEVPVVRVIENADWAEVTVECMNAAGFDSYEVSNGGISSTVDPTASRDADALAMFVCQAQYPVDVTESGFVGAGQRGYLYDYYKRWLIPCLGWQGYDVTPIPERRDFVRERWEQWSPYTSPAMESVLQNVGEMRRLGEVCAAMPAGLAG